MIQAEVHREGELLMTRTYQDPTLTLEGVMKQLEKYVVEEQFNLEGECVIRVRFNNLKKKAA